MHRVVYHNGMALSAQSDVLDELGLRSGQDVTEAQMWAVIAGNASSFSAEMKLRKAQGLSAPETAALDACLARVRPNPPTTDRA